MSDPNVLLFGTSYVDTQERKWLSEQWERLAIKLNPEMGIAVLGTPGSVEWVPKHCYYWETPDNIGHLGKTGKDGWGRAFTTGIQRAIEHGFDYVAHVECDILFARPIMPIIQRMERFGIKAISAWAHPYAFIETGIMFLNVAWLKEIDFIARYDWENPPPPEKVIVPERRVELILGDDLFMLPLRGIRDDLSGGKGDLRKAFFYGIDWVTHTSIANYRLFLEMNGLSE